MTRKMPWLRDSEYARHHLYNKCSRATKVETWTTQREDIQIDEFSRAITGEREREREPYNSKKFSALSLNSFFEEFLRKYFK